MGSLSRANLERLIAEVDRCVEFLQTQTARPRVIRLAARLTARRAELQRLLTDAGAEPAVVACLEDLLRLRQAAAAALDSARTVFPVVFDSTSVAVGDACTLCRDSFSTDDRGLPILDHPELGKIPVCYPCAEELGTT